MRRQDPDNYTVYSNRYSTVGLYFNCEIIAYNENASAFYFFYMYLILPSKLQSIPFTRVADPCHLYWSWADFFNFDGSGFQIQAYSLQSTAPHKKTNGQVTNLYCR